MKKVIFTLLVLPMAVICIMTPNVSASTVMQLIIDNAAVAQLQQTVRTDQYNVAVLTAKVQYDTNPFVKAVDSALLAAADSKLDSDFIALVMAEQKLMYDQTH